VKKTYKKATPAEKKPEAKAEQAEKPEKAEKAEKVGLSPK